MIGKNPARLQISAWVLAGLLGACGSKATLVTPKGSALKVDTSNHSPLSPNNLGNPGLVPKLQNVSSPDTSLSVPSFGASIHAVDLDIDAQSGLARLVFTHWPVPGQISTVGPLLAHLSAATAAGGVDMDPPPGVVGYSAHLQCKTTDCASAVIRLSKTQTPLVGTAEIRIERVSSEARPVITVVGKPLGIQAQIVAALQSPGPFHTLTTLIRVEKGANFFKIEFLNPDEDHRVVVRGTLGEHANVSMSYYEVTGDVATGTRQDYDTTATYSEPEQALHISFALQIGMSELTVSSSRTK